MSPTVAFLLLLATIISAAKLGGLTSVRLGQPAVLGELMAGLLLGPTVLNVLHLPLFASAHLDEVVFIMAEIGVIALMFMAGLEVELGEMLRSGRVAGSAGLLGVIAPFLLGALTAQVFGFPLVTSLFIGIILSATSVSISAQTLIELRVLRSREGFALLGAAVFDDILVLLLLSFFLALASGTGRGPIGLVIVLLQVILYLVFSTVIGARLFRPLMERASGMPVSEGLLALVFVLMLLFAWGAEVIGGLAAITGAFLAGLFIARTPVKPVIEEGMHTLAYALFVPVFFVSIGLEANARALGLDSLGFVVAICAIAIISKVLGSGLGARLAGFSNGEAMRLGIGMVSRGEVGLIVAAVGIANGLIDDSMLAAMVMMVLVTTFVTPPMLRAAFARAGQRAALRPAIRPAAPDIEPE